MASDTPTKEVAARYARIMNLDVKVNEDGTRTRAILPCLTYDDFNRTGNFSAWKILRLIEVARLFQSWITKIENVYKSAGVQVYVVVGANSSHISQDFYKMAKLNYPLCVTLTPGYIGPTAASAITRVTDAKTDQLLFWVEQLVIWIDKQTRKPAKLPETLLKQLLPYTVGNVRPRYHMLKYSKPYFKDDYKVAYSDTDFMNHLNHAYIVRYCMDCANHASLKGFFVNFHGDMCEYNVREMTLLYKGEAFAGDTVSVLTWEPVGSKDTLHFNIIKSDKIILYCTMSFFPRSPNPKL